MFNVRYYKDLNHNYLIIKNKMAEEKNYQHKMLHDNKIKCLLDCKIRYVDEECHFYYEISSKQNMISLFGKKEIGYEQLYHLFEQLESALATVENYLLDSRYLQLMPEYIYGEPESEEYAFLYYPYEIPGHEHQSGLMSLAEFLVEKVNHDEESAVEVVYKIYELAQEDRFILSEILKLFDPDLLEREENSSGYKEEMLLPQEKDEEGYYREEEKYWAEESDHNKIEKTYDKAQDKGNLIIVGILAFLCAVGAAGIFVIGYFYTLSFQEKMIATAALIILVVLSAFLLIYFLFHFFKGRNRSCEKDDRDTPSVTNRNQFYAPEPVYYENKEDSINGKKERKTAEPDREEYGNTVFLETSMCIRENKLFGTNKGNKYHIDLNHLPCTVGKLAGSVDVVIRDSTISRIHARFTKKGEDIYVTDMNSTNGTFKNGLRLEPNETVLIEQGDELRFGKMTFCYR